MAFPKMVLILTSSQNLMELRTEKQDSDLLNRPRRHIYSIVSLPRLADNESIALFIFPTLINIAMT